MEEAGLLMFQCGLLPAFTTTWLVQAQLAACFILFFGDPQVEVSIFECYVGQSTDSSVILKYLFDTFKTSNVAGSAINYPHHPTTRTLHAPTTHHHPAYCTQHLFCQLLSHTRQTKPDSEGDLSSTPSQS
jgi:hypothetical protein